MSHQRNSGRQDQSLAGASIGRQTDHPVVGIVATPDNAGAVASTILRGQDKEYDTIVCHGGNPSLESVVFAERLGATVVEIENSHQDGVGFKDTLTQAAREVGYPGVLYHVTPEEPIDFDSSSNRIHQTDQYLINAIPQSHLRTYPEILVAIPAYNEASSIADIVTESLEFSDEVIVVDDGSSDETVSLARKAGATVIEHETNRGYGGALATAFTEAARCHADYLVILDGDGQHDPNDIPKLVDTHHESSAEIVIGSRSVENSETDMPLYRRFGFGVVNLLTNFSMGVVRPSSRVSDTQSGFRLYDKNAIYSLANDNIGRNMSASTDILHHAHKNGYTIEEAGTKISYDVDDASSHHPVKHGIQLISNLVRTIERERPLSALGIPGFISTAIGLFFVYWTFSNYLSTGTFPISLAIISGLFGLLGAFASFTAIILHSLETHSNG